MSTPDPVKAAWQSSVPEANLPPIETIRGWADTFYRKIRRRNRIEYAACAFVVPVFAGYAVFLHNPIARIGAVLVVLGTLFVAWQLRRLAAAVPPPEAAGASTILAYQRDQLVRQRDALAKVFQWYLLPLLPGLTLMMLAPAIAPGGGVPRSAPWQLGLAISYSAFMGVWLLNRWVARKLQKYIDGIDALTGGKE